MDWTAPHYNVLEMFSSALLSNFLPQTSYRHDCYRTRQSEEATIGCDATTIQQAIPLAFTDFNFDLIPKTSVIEQCKAVLANYDPNVESKRVKSMAMRHPFLWPEAPLSQFGVGTPPTSLPVIPTKPYLIPLSGILVPIFARLQRSSLDWVNVTLSPPREEESGAIIHIDPSTSAIDPSIFSRYLLGPTSITVLVPPICRTAYLQTGELCWDYAERILAQLQKDYPKIGNSGFENTPGIKLESPCSTAGSWSRIMRARLVICPPSTPSCMLPALGKKPGTTILFLETSTNRDASEFFTFTGTRSKVRVEMIDSSSVLPTLPRPQPVLSYQAPNGAPLAATFVDVQYPVDPETGIPSVLSPVSKETVLSVRDIPSDAILTRFFDIVKVIPETNPNANRLRREDILKLSEVISFHDLSKPINDNYGIPIEEVNGGNPRDVSSELGTDWMAGLSTTAFDPITTFKLLREQRKASVARILEDNQMYQDTVFKENSPNFNLHIQIWCPREGTVDAGGPIFQDPSETTPTSGGNQRCDDSLTSLIWMDGSQAYDTMPIKIVSRDVNTVTFRVAQTWKQTGSVASMFTVYHGGDDNDNSNDMVCARTHSIASEDSVGSYTAICEHGVTPVRVFVYDPAFYNGANDVVVPSICGATDDEMNFKQGYTFEVPCTPSCRVPSSSNDSTQTTPKSLPIISSTPVAMAPGHTRNAAPTLAVKSAKSSADGHDYSGSDVVTKRVKSSGSSSNDRSEPVAAPSLARVKSNRSNDHSEPNHSVPADTMTTHSPTSTPIKPTPLPTLKPTLLPTHQLTQKPTTLTEEKSHSSRSGDNHHHRHRRLQDDADQQLELVSIPAAEFKFGRKTAEAACAKYQTSQRKRALQGLQQQQQPIVTRSRATQVFLARQQRRPKQSIVTLIKNYGPSNNV
jgi:hypothetical protein